MHHEPDSVAYKKALMEILYERYAPVLLMQIRHHRMSREDAEDVLVEVFLAALESPTLLTLPEKKQFAWLQRVARNKVIDHLRRAARRQAVNVDEWTEMLTDSEQRAPEQIVLQHEEHAQLRAHLATLPAHQQEVLRLRFGEGLRTSEIGQYLHKSEGAVRMLLSRAMSFLRTT